MSTARQISSGGTMLRVRPYLALAAVLWTTAVGGALWWDLRTEAENIVRLAQTEAKVLSDRYLLFLDPAFMTVGVHEIEKREHGRWGRAVSLNPVNKANAADSWEAESLHAFQSGMPERSSLEPLNGQTYLRHMVPLMAREMCIECHTGQGYSEGSLLGGISVSVPLYSYVAAKNAHRKATLSVYGLVWMIGLVGIGIGGRSLHKRVTEIRRSHMALRESEEWHRTILQTAMDGFWLVDTQGRLLEVNESYCRMSGYSVLELLAMRILDLDAVETEDDIAARRQEIMMQGVNRFESRHRRKDGSIIDVEVSVQDRSMKGGRFVVFLRDITERKRAEGALRESEERLRLALRAANQGLYDLNVQTGEATVNAEYASLLGYAPDEFRETNIQWRERLHPDDRESVYRIYQEYIAGQHDEYRVEFRQRTKTGDWKWLLSVGKIVEWDEAGQPLRMLGTHTDITDRKLAEETLRESEGNLNATLDATADGILAVDREERILFANRRFQELWNIPQPLLDSRDDKLLINHVLVQLTDPEAFMKEVQCLYASNDDSLDLLHFRDGRIFERLSQSLRNQEGLPSGRVWSFRDITERKRAEAEREKLQAQLNQAQKMESVGRLAGGVAHDFNNMLSVILGHAEMALEHVDPAEPLRADLTEIRKAAERSANLTRQLLAFARKQTVVPKVLDLNETVAGMLKMLQRLIGENIDILWLPGAGLGTVKVDPSQIDQILTNLCVNARDAIADVGKITIETKNCTFDEEYCAVHAGSVPGEYVRLAVSDDGCGMDKETLSHLFEPFFTTKAVGEGTGLGLATVYGAVKQNNGFISAYSEPGQGTTFTIYLPRHVGKSEQLRTKDPAEATGRRHATVLLVEDEPSILNMCRIMLESLGYKVLAASTPGEAIRLAETHPGEIHLLLTDVVMPEMNGRDLAKNLLSLYPQLKCLFMSGYTADVIAHHGVLDKGVYFIEKPFPLSGLAAKVREALSDE